MTDCKVFYSWQSDLPNSTNRGFIQRALEDAVKAIRNDDLIEVEPVVDRDTAGVPGSPDIMSTIFGKIERAAVFVCDISIINAESESRLTPNPNVLIELGYAIKALGSERIIMVINRAFGAPEQLPFDLRMRRVIPYNLPQDTTEKAPVRKQLEKQLLDALNTIFIDQASQTVGEIIQPLSIGEQARIAVENAQPNQEALTRKFMNNLVEQLDSIAPDFTKSVSDQMIVDAIEQTIELGVDFARLAEAVALMNASKVAMIIYKSFELILSHYDMPDGFAGIYYELAFDFYKFVGHEFFVMLFSFLIREERWEIVTEILDEDFYVSKLYGHSNPATVPFTHICSGLQSLHDRKQRLGLDRVSVRADLLNERHTQGSLATAVPMRQFVDADCFLFLRSALQDSESDRFSSWTAYSLIYIKQPPKYLIEAYRIKNAQKLLEPLKMASVEMLRNRMAGIGPKFTEAFRGSLELHFRQHALGKFDPQAIGSKP